MILLALALLAGCGARIDCSDPEALAAEHLDQRLSCEEAGRGVAYLQLLAGRPLTDPQRDRILRAIVASFRKDPQGTRDWLEALRVEGRAVEGGAGMEGAERRGTRVWRAVAGDGFPEHADLRAARDEALAVWARDDEERLALTEMDIEGWIHYASLCREVQGGGPLRLSLSDRVQVYRMVRTAFEEGSREEQIALLAIGPYWGQIREGWQMASYERQQAWIAAAPLPPPMTATSLGYLEAVLRGDLPRHAEVLHRQIGPFTMVKGRPVFSE